ncbi:MAG: CoA-binding protein [Actinomycetota bacterium]|nr:CoA-binding protein [Actinomycetota bacterium]
MHSETDDAVEKILGYAKRIAVVGASDDPWRASYGVVATLIDHGYEVIPVNPGFEEVLGLRSYPTLADVPGDIDVVDVFRRQEHLPGVAREAADVGARALWLQVGLRSPEARRTAEAAGMDYVEDVCLKVEVATRDRIIELPTDVTK